MAQGLQELAPFLEALCSIPKWQFTISSKSSSRGSDILSWPLRALHACMWCTHVSKIPTYKIKMKFKHFKELEMKAGEMNQSKYLPLTGEDLSLYPQHWQRKPGASSMRL